ncbi:PEP/pyruvate-binding domain-containing protein, partial [Endozoicomonas sp. ONNA1]
SELRRVVTELENLLLCPVDVEFAIDHQGRLFLLQVRPVTRLSGGMDFAMSIPEDSLATGEGASEGFCTGPLWLANKRDSGAMPEGAIVVAHHAEEWMLEPECLNRAGGVVFTEGGFNDHVAILLRQKKIPLMLVGGEYAAMVAQNGQPVTLACARFKDKPGAFVVAGDITENLDSHRSLSSAVSDVSSVKAIPLRDDLSPSEGAFSRVTSGFQWLTDQNARLLAFFAPGYGLDCLANPIKLSMSPQRSKLLAETGESVSRLIHGAEAMLKGYQSFLLLADNSGSFQHKSLLNEVPQLNNRFGALKKTIQSRVEAVVHPMQASEEGQVFPFRQWLAECHQLQSSLQALHSRKAEQCQSVHDLIFALHQRFVAALAPVALASGQGRISKERYMTYVDCTSPGEEAPLLRASDKASMKKLGLSGTVVSMDDALIVNLKLGSHVGLVELLEHADGGKERTLRLRFSDQFEEPDGVDEDGKLKRMWFLVQSLKAIGLDENSDSMKLGCNAVAGEITVECPRMKSRNNMQGAFEKLIIVLDEMYNLDSLFECRAIFEGDQWDFNLLAQRLNGNVATEAERFAFEHCLFLVFCRRVSSSSDAFCQLLSDHYQRFIHHGQCLRVCVRHVFIEGKSKDSLREMLMSDEISEDMRRELLQHLLLLYPDEATLLVEDVYPDFRDQYFVISPSMDYKLKFAVPPFDLPPYNLRPTHWLAEHKEKLKKALLKHGLKYGSQRVRECHSSFTDRLGNLRITSNLF